MNCVQDFQMSKFQEWRNQTDVRNRKTREIQKLTGLYIMYNIEDIAGFAVSYFRCLRHCKWKKSYLIKWN